MPFEIKDLTKVYGHRTVLDIPALHFEKGNVCALLGPNGSGKTTLLEILGLLIPPTSGAIHYDGKIINFKGDDLTALRREIVMVQQNPVIFTATVYKNLEFGLKVRRIPKRERRHIIEESLDMVGMRPFAGAEARKLSSGESQRVAIARALACSPRVIFLDEPTASVDVENQITIERIIQDINRSKGISIIFTTHDMIQASRLANQTVFLFEGRVARSIYENIFSARIETDATGRKYCLLQNGLRLRVQSEKPGPARISIDPGGLNISQKGSNSLTDNTFKGRLIQLTDEQSRVRALVDVGIPLSVLIPKEVFRSLHLGMGDDVWLTCPVETIDVF